MLVYDIMPSSDSVKYCIFEDSDISREETMCFVLFSGNAASVSGPMLFKGIMHSSVKHHIFEHSDLTQHSGSKDQTPLYVADGHALQSGKTVI